MTFGKRNTPGGAPPVQPQPQSINQRFDLLVALPSDGDTTFEALKAAASGIMPGFAQSMVPGGKSGHAVTFLCGSIVLALIWSRGPFPQSPALTQALARNRPWPGAERALAAAQGHYMVTTPMHAAKTSDQALQLASLVTLTGAALVKASRGIGVL